MKITIAPAIALAALASAVAAQNSTGGSSTTCIQCLQDSLRALPLCKGLNITMGNFDPGSSPEYAVCLCSSLDGAWISNCRDPSKCGPDIDSLKNSYPSSLDQAGLRCNGTNPTFIPAPTDPVAPSSTFPSGSSPTGQSAGQLDAIPSAVFTRAMAAVAVVMAIGASFI
ncbi:hypothetical protein B0O80DRAFT_434572 [Mortierella sp. GBAus27b]|nr:hypothetical protein B0O80DRAFT_434572 [Mortierella sp. GBAus27b]